MEKRIEAGIELLDSLHAELEIFTGQGEEFYDDLFNRLGYIIAVLKGEIDTADAPDDESAAEPRFMVPVKRDDGTIEPVYLPAYWDEDGNLRQRK
jgi:hypothetical protein